MNRQQKLIARAVSRIADDLVVLDDSTNVKLLESFQQGVFPDRARQTNRDFRNWLYLTKNRGRLLYCEKDGIVAGQQGMIDTELQVQSRGVPAVWAVDLRVRPEWKMKGLGVALIGTALSQNGVVLAVGISDDAHKMFKRQGWVDLGRVASFIRPVSARGMAKHGSPQSFIGRAIRSMIAFVLEICDFKLRILLGFGRRGIEIERVKKFDDSIDSFLSTWAAEHVVSCARSADFLNWRFRDCPLDSEYQIYKFSDKDKLMGYMVLCSGERNGKQTLFVEELISRPEHYRLLVDSAIRFAYEQGLDAIYYRGLDSKLQQTLSRRLFVGRSDGPRFMFHCDNDRIGSVLAKSANWRISSADSDMGFSLDS